MASFPFRLKDLESEALRAWLHPSFVDAGGSPAEIMEQKREQASRQDQAEDAVQHHEASIFWGSAVCSCVLRIDLRCELHNQHQH